MSFSGWRTDTRHSTEVRWYLLPQRERTGVTLIEILVVLAILAVVVGLALPRLDSARFRADANVRLVRMALEEAQKLSTQQKHDVIVSFDITGGRIRVLEDRDSSRSLTVGEPVAWRGLTEGARFAVPPTGINGPVATAVGSDSVATLDAMPTVVFHRNGTASSNIEIYIQVEGKRANTVRAVTLEGLTGRTHAYKYSSSAWKSGGN